MLAEYEYDELSRRILLTLGNDANAVYEYDLADRIIKLTNNLDDTNSITFDCNDYDKVGNRRSLKIDDANAHVYTYDVLYQLTNVDYNDGNTAAYTYDSLGNRTDVNESGTTTSYKRNSLNEYTSVGGTSYSYDDNGNLTDDGTYEYYYDCENRLTDVNENGSTVAMYAYDYLGRRISKTVDGNTIEYIYDGDRVIAERDGDGYLLRRYYYGPGIDEPICLHRFPRGGSGLFYYHYDPLGSVVALSDTNGMLVERYEYDVYGEPTIYDANDTVITESLVGNPYMFTGRRFDDETGLYYYRARYYSPEIGRFISRDPIGYAAGMNLYTYARNNPINYTDPEGLTRKNPCNRPCSGKKGAKAYYKCWFKCLKWAPLWKAGFIAAKKAAVSIGTTIGKAAGKWIGGVGWAWLTVESIHCTYKCTKECL